MSATKALTKFEGRLVGNDRVPLSSAPIGLWIHDAPHGARARSVSDCHFVIVRGHRLSLANISVELDVKLLKVGALFPSTSKMPWFAARSYNADSTVLSHRFAFLGASCRVTAARSALKLRQVEFVPSTVRVTWRFGRGCEDSRSQIANLSPQDGTFHLVGRYRGQLVERSASNGKNKQDEGLRQSQRS
jgi:hypothetical protein